MTSYIMYNDIKIEVLDKQAFFEEGEKLFIEEGNKKISHTITGIVKVLQCNGDKCDVIQEIHIT